VKRWVVVEVALLVGAIAIVWWLGDHATAAWLHRVDKLKLAAPDGVQHAAADGVQHAAHSACVYMTSGIIALIAGRLVARRSETAISVPWLLPAAVGAALLGFAVHLATVEVSHGTALVPTAVGFAQGFLVGAIAGAVLLAAPVDLVDAASRARGALAIAIAAIFIALGVLGSGPAGSGTRINLGPVQPIEVVKPLAVVFLAVYFGSRASKLRWHRRRFLGLRWPRVELLVPALGMLMLIIAGLRLVGDLGPVLLLAFVFLGMFFIASRATGWVVVAIAIVGVLLLVLAHAPALAGSGTVKTRLVMWQDPWTNGMTNGHQLGEGLWAFAAGGWRGQGLAHAITPLVPAGKTDLVLATFVEQAGALGLVAYSLAIGSLVVGAFFVAARSRTAERALIAGGLGVLLLAQWIVIAAGSLGYLPLTGIVVPFMSGGRSSMAVFVVVVALVVRVAADGRARVGSTELDELHGAVNSVSRVALGLAILITIAGVAAATISRGETSTRGIRVRLADGTLITRFNPRLVRIAEQLRRGPIVDRNGVELASSPTPNTRRYPLGNALGTLMGIADAKVLLPSWSLERIYDRRLRGYTDFRSFIHLLDASDDERDAAIAEVANNVTPRTVKLTLDAKLQAKAAELARLAHEQAVAAVVLDVDTGQVLARVQYPDYDPNKPAWQDRVLAGDATYVRRFHGAYGEWPDKTGIQGMFQSGSVGKLFTALAAVRAHKANEHFDCVDQDAQGPLFTLPGWPKPIHDFTGDHPHGSPDLASAIAVSCNVYFAQLGIALGPEPLRELRTAGVDVGYGASLTPGKPGSRQLASTAFGQGAMVMNTMQAARLVAAIAAGGRYTRCPPSMELDATFTTTDIVDDPASLAPIIAGMRRVMTSGTGYRLDEPAGLRVYGKTGTADVRGFVGEEPFGIAPAEVAAPHSWFVAFAESTSVAEGAPVAKGRLAIAVVVPRGGTGATSAGPLAMQILAAARDLGYLR
jgi:cell division protein FtsI/penicillin-binding protein 2/cell division protein FtsW (lipid II flippase)